MSVVTVIYTLLLYLAAAVFLAGITRKIISYACTPQPLKIPTTPAPTTRIGVIIRVAREVILFESLFKANKWTWSFGWIFHYSMLLLLLRHLFYFTDPVWSWVLAIQPIGDYAAAAMLIGLAGLWCRRLLVDRIRYISSLSDHLMLALLVGIAASGLAMNYFDYPDIIAVKAFIRGLITFKWQPLSAIPLLMLHLALVAILLIVFPLSKLLHAPGIFFSPAINQVDNPREIRWVSGWSAEINNTEGKKHGGTDSAHE